jgi:hypothetical protein
LKEIVIMGPMLLTLWLALCGKAPRKRSPRRRPVCYRPDIEVLEDRAVPASLGYSTLLGGTVYATAVDSAGNLYVTGGADSGLSTTPGALDPSGYGSFVAKLDPTGTAVLYATYLSNDSRGGEGTSIALDANGDAYVIGTNGGVPTTANAIASSAVYDANADTDFVAELNPTGTGLLYGTYLPNTDNASNDVTYSSALAVDGTGNIYAVGAAQPGFPTTVGSFQPAFAGQYTGGTEAFLAKIDPALWGTASLLYSSYLGGGQGFGDAATGIALDGGGNAYLEGFTQSTDFPTTSGAFQTSKGGGRFNAFVAKFNPALSGAASLVYSTYLGGSDGGSIVNHQAPYGAGFVPNKNGIVVPEIAGGIAVDSAGNAYVTSATTSPNFPTTSGAYQTTSNLNPADQYGGFQDADVFVTKLNATGSALVYSTYLGGGANNGIGTHSGGASIAVDASGDAYVTGWTDSASFPTNNPVQSANGGGFNGLGAGMDAFVTELNPSGSGLLFSTYLGGGGNDYGYGIAVDSAGNASVGGQTSSSNFPTTAGAFNTASGSGFAAKIGLAPSPSFAVTGFPSSTTAGVSQTFSVTALNANGTVNTGYTGTVQFTSSDTQAVLPANYAFTAADQGVHSFMVALNSAGSQSITATDTATGSITGSESNIVVTPAVASEFILSAPSSVSSGKKFSVTLTVEDAYGNVVTGYTGTVHFSSSDSTASLPTNYTFRASDAGVHTFAGVMLRKKGKQTLTVTDTVDSSLTTTDITSVG